MCLSVFLLTMRASLPDSTKFVPRALPPECGFAGTSDLYGLGIRSGIYLQWFTGLIANCYQADSVVGQLDTNTIFLLALFAALANVTAKGSIQAAEVIILLQFCFGFLLTVLSIWGMRVKATYKSQHRFEKSPYFSYLGSSIRSCLASAICFYTAWFWFHGVDKLSRHPCHPVTFLFAPVSAFGGARVFFKIYSIISACIFGSAMVIEIDLFLFNWLFYCFIGFSASSLLLIPRIERLRKEASSTASSSFAILRYLVALFAGVPWIFANTEADAGLSRLQSLALNIVIIWLLAPGEYFFQLLSLAIDLIQLLYRFARATRIIKPSKITEPGPEPGESPIVPGIQSPVPFDFEGISTIGKKSNENLQTRPGVTDPTLPGSSRPFNEPIWPATSQLVSGGVAAGDTGRDQNPGYERKGNFKMGSFKPGVQENSTDMVEEEEHYNGRLRPWIDLIEKAWKTAHESTITSILQQLSIFWFIPSFNLAFIIWSIISIELTLKWNRIDGVYELASVGQLIPFIIGIVGFVKLLRDISVERCELWIYELVLVCSHSFNLEWYC